MTTEKLKKILNSVAAGTDFSFAVDVERNKEITLYMRGDNPENEDWVITFNIADPKTKKELLQNLYREVYDAYMAFDIEEEVTIMLEAKRNGFQGVPNVVDLVHNEEYKEQALEEFYKKIAGKC